MYNIKKECAEDWIKKNGGSAGVADARKLIQENNISLEKVQQELGSSQTNSGMFRTNFTNYVVKKFKTFRNINPAEITNLEKLIEKFFGPQTVTSGTKEEEVPVVPTPVVPTPVVPTTVTTPTGDDTTVSTDIVPTPIVPTTVTTPTGDDTTVSTDIPVVPTPVVPTPVVPTPVVPTPEQVAQLAKQKEIDKLYDDIKKARRNQIVFYNKREADKKTWENLINQDDPADEADLHHLEEQRGEAELAYMISILAQYARSVEV